MSYISLIIAFLATSSSEGAWLNELLKQLVIVEQWFYNTSFSMFGFLFSIIMSFSILYFFGHWFQKKMTVIAVIVLSCLPFIFPLLEGVTLQLAKNMASSVTPFGVTEPFKLVLNGILFILLGIG